MNRDDALRGFHRARRAYRAARDVYATILSRPLAGPDPAADAADQLSSRTALQAAEQAYDAAIDQLAQAATAEERAKAAERQWRRAAHEYTANASLANYRRLNAAHAAYKRTQAAAGLRPTEH